MLAELVNDDGTVKRLPDCLEFAKAHGLRIVSIADLIEYRQRRDQLVRRVTSFEVATAAGPATAIVYATPFDPIQHVALVMRRPRRRRAACSRASTASSPWAT